MKTQSHIQNLYQRHTEPVAVRGHKRPICPKEQANCYRICSYSGRFDPTTATESVLPLKVYQGEGNCRGALRLANALFEGSGPRRPIAKKRRPADHNLSTPVHVCRDCRGSSRGLASTCRAADVQRSLNVRCHGLLLACCVHAASTATSIGLAHAKPSNNPLGFQAGAIGSTGSCCGSISTRPCAAGQRIRNLSAICPQSFGRHADAGVRQAFGRRSSSTGNACTVTSPLPDAFGMRTACAAHVDGQPSTGPSTRSAARTSAIICAQLLASAGTRRDASARVTDSADANEMRGFAGATDTPRVAAPVWQWAWGSPPPTSAAARSRSGAARHD